jgi:hypothetical protein
MPEYSFPTIIKPDGSHWSTEAKDEIEAQKKAEKYLKSIAKQEESQIETQIETETPPITNNNQE